MSTTETVSAQLSHGIATLSLITFPAKSIIAIDFSRMHIDEECNCSACETANEVLQWENQGYVCIRFDPLVK